MSRTSLFNSNPRMAVIGAVLAAAVFGFPRDSEAQRSGSGHAYLSLPLAFEPTADERGFITRAAGLDAQVNASGAAFILKNPTARSAASRASMSVSPRTFKMELVGANAGAVGSGLELLGSKSNYFIGSEPSRWRRNVGNYEKVRFSGVYPNVDLLYYGNQRQLEYDFV